MYMRAAERAELARLTYERAVAYARAQCTPGSWARLLTAARNLAAALREKEGGPSGRAAASPGRALGGAPLAERGARTGASSGQRRPGTPPRPPGTPDPGSGARPRAVLPPTARVPWADLLNEWARSLLLMEWSRRLVREARALSRSLSASRGAALVESSRCL